MRVTAVILAAGASSRMRGRVKALLPLKAPWGEPAGELAVARIGRLLKGAGVGRIVVVLGHHAEAIRSVVGRFADLAINPEPDRGMFSSVQVGLEVALKVPSAPDGVLVWPVDVPLVSGDTLELLLSCGLLESPGVPQVAQPALTETPDRTGHPILMSRALAESVLGADVEGGRLDVAMASAEPIVIRAKVRDRHMLVDLDSPEEARPFVWVG